MSKRLSLLALAIICICPYVSAQRPRELTSASHAPTQSSASLTTITFDDFPGFTIIDDEYKKRGVLFKTKEGYRLFNTLPSQGPVVTTSALGTARASRTSPDAVTDPESFYKAPIMIYFIDPRYAESSAITRLTVTGVAFDLMLIGKANIYWFDKQLKLVGNEQVEGSIFSNLVDLLFKNKNKYGIPGEIAAIRIELVDPDGTLMIDNLSFYINLPKEIKNACDSKNDDYKSTPESRKIAASKLEEVAPYLLAAAKEFDIDPNLLAGALYSEWARNVDWKDKFDNFAAMSGVLDTSLGIGQVRMSTAERIESNMSIGASSDRSHRVDRLNDPKENARYMAQYFKTLREQFPYVADELPVMLSLYNKGAYNDGDPEKGLRSLGDPPEYGCFAAESAQRLEYFKEVFRRVEKK